MEWAFLQSLRVPEAKRGLPELQGAMLSIPPSREAPPPGTRAAVRDLQVRSGLWVPHPQDATVPPDGSVTRPSPTAPLSQDAAPGWPWWPFSLGLEPCPLWVAL